MDRCKSLDAANFWSHSNWETQVVRFISFTFNRGSYTIKKTMNHN